MDKSSHELKKRVWEMTESIFMQWSMKMVVNRPATTSAALSDTIDAVAQLATLNHKVEKVV